MLRSNLKDPAKYRRSFFLNSIRLSIDLSLSKELARECCGEAMALRRALESGAHLDDAVLGTRGVVQWSHQRRRSCRCHRSSDRMILG